MKYALTFLVILFLSISANAQAAESVSSYILQKQAKAQQLKLNTEMKVQNLRSMPKNVAHVQNTTPKSNVEEASVTPMSPNEFEAIETAAGGKAAKSSSGKAAKLLTK